jgi:hypothetical protein
MTTQNIQTIIKVRNRTSECWIVSRMAARWTISHDRHCDGLAGDQQGSDRPRLSHRMASPKLRRLILSPPFRWTTAFRRSRPTTARPPANIVTPWSRWTRVTLQHAILAEVELYRVDAFHVDVEPGSNVLARARETGIFTGSHERVRYQPAQTPRTASGTRTSASPIRAVRGIRPITFHLDTDAL